MYPAWSILWRAGIPSVLPTAYTQWDIYDGRLVLLRSLNWCTAQTGISGSQMQNDLSKADYYRHLLDECVVIAKTATSNEVRAKYYATAESLPAPSRP